MTGEELRTIRQDGLELGRTKFALLLGYVGSDRNNKLRVARLEAMVQVPLYIARFAWLLDHYAKEHNGNLPHWPNNLLIEGEDEPWT